MSAMSSQRRRLDAEAVQRASNYTASYIGSLVMKLTKMNKQRRVNARRRLGNKVAIHPSLLKP
jgi:hypothetical protein